MKAISQEQYETFDKHYQLLCKQTQTRQYEINENLEPNQFEQMKKYGCTGLWCSEVQRVSEESKYNTYIIRKQTNEVVKQVKTLWEVVDFVNNEMPCDLLEG